MKKLLSLFAVLTLCMLVLGAVSSPALAADAEFSATAHGGGGGRGRNWEAKIDEFLEIMTLGIPNAQTVAIFFADKQPEDTYISCYDDYVNGIPSTCAGYQNEPTNMYTWFMPQVYATCDLPPWERLVISDYDIIPDDAPLKQFYPPFFVSVSDYILWEDEDFIGWIGILSTDQPIDWEESRSFITWTVRRYQWALHKAYYEDFLPGLED